MNEKAVEADQKTRQKPRTKIGQQAGLKKDKNGKKLDTNN